MTHFKFQKLGLAVSIGLASTCLAAMPAAAQASNMQEMVEKADANGDGDISWSEIEAARLEVFQRVDRNGDGVVNTADRPRAKLWKARQAVDLFGLADLVGHQHVFDTPACEDFCL